jgi:hypothetical protein
MMTMTNPITPPPKLVQQWLRSDDYLWGPLEQTSITITSNRLQNVATQAAQWGADQELEACCEWLFENAYPHKVASVYLRAARRPQPPSLKEQALTALHAVAARVNDTREQHQDLDTIRRALEALPE